MARLASLYEELHKDELESKETGVAVPAEEEAGTKKEKHKAEKILLYGGRAKAHTFPMGEFKKNGVKVFTATDDGSVGVKGRVSALFNKIAISPSTMIYTCGPRPMMAAVQVFVKTHGLQGEASCEEVMACGLGACLGCSIPTTKGYQTVCHDGPVFDIKELVF